MRFQDARDEVIDLLKNNLPASCSSHNLRHALLSEQFAIELAGESKLNENSTCFIRIALLLHNSGYIVLNVDNTETGCLFASEILPAHGFSKNKITEVCNLIKATSLPQQPGNLNEQILCDADMGYLGTSDFFVFSEKMRTELACRGQIYSNDQWQDYVLEFLQSHRYFTACARKKWQEGKKRNLEKIRSGEFLQKDCFI